MRAGNHDFIRPIIMYSTMASKVWEFKNMISDIQNTPLFIKCSTTLSYA